MLLLKWLQEQCNHPAQGLTGNWSDAIRSTVDGRSSVVPFAAVPELTKHCNEPGGSVSCY